MSPLGAGRDWRHGSARSAGFSFILISNQAGIARHIVSKEQVDAVNNRLTDELALRGIKLIDVYVCPHHWDDGCNCRKPAPGLLFKASREHLLRLDRTFYIGDDPRDCQAAYNANCAGIFIGDGDALASLTAAERPVHSAKTLSKPRHGSSTVLRHGKVA